ncbi:MAG: exodeoxyribonuclease V subunit beta [Pseudomonadota bacterium]|nr:exodeoxyribonuclease V subunit beta [Pseudomonadota bacterium]
MSAPASFDVFGCALAGVNLIEASAGTGKTWNICALYMRLLLERQLLVQQILVVTFTNAATAELREGVRKRIAQTLGYVTARGPHHDDPFVRDLVRALERACIPTQSMIDRLELALQSFDEAAIFTIHGFCQRALADAPFAAGAAFEVELLPSDDAIPLEVAQDFWRKRVAGRDCHPALASLLAEKKDEPERFKLLLGKRIAKPLALLRWPDDLRAPVMLDTRALEAAHTSARATWMRARQEIEQTLLDGLKALSKTTYKPDRLARSFAEWEEHFAVGNPFASLKPGKARLELCRASRLNKCTNQGRLTPMHRFFDEVEALFVAREALDAELSRARLLLIHDLLRDGPDEVRKRKRSNRVLAYDDILYNLHDALHAKPDSAALAARLRTRFPAALIDEFQDTDPVQFGIFRTLYGSGEVPLFVVGDPKQAIYSFRNADLYTYLEARKLASAEHTLAENQRSTGPLIDAVNALFGHNPRAFMLPHLDYQPVRVGARGRKAFSDTSPVPRADACVWLLPTGASGEVLPRREASDAAMRATAGEIARLLREARAGRITYDGRALAAGDMAVLVRSHAQGTRMREQLRSLGIGSVELAQASVFASKDAEDIERLLLAVLEPASARYLKSALATELLGFDAAAIERLVADEAKLVTHMESFARFRDSWLREGFGVMYRKLLSEMAVTARMLARPDGERRLTNLLHLGERLHDAAQLNVAPDALLRWLHAQRNADAADEVAQLRLESDRNLVQIVTVHKAKGLEYPIVFCPFLWDGYRFPQREWPGACAYHDPDGTAVVDFRSEVQQGTAAPSIKAQARTESSAETVRLLYVALTRASHRCYLVAGCYGNKTSAGKLAPTESTRSMLNWLVAGDNTLPDAWCDSSTSVPAITAAWSALGSPAGGAFTVTPLPTDAPQPFDELIPAPETLSARPSPAEIVHGWRISSYSGLAFDAGSEMAAADHDVRLAAPIVDLSPPVDVAGDDILRFPRGPLAGECLHAALERSDFTRPDTWRSAAEHALAGSEYRGDRATATLRTAMIAGMVRDVVATPLCKAMRLAQVPLSRRLTELEFSLPAPRLTAAALNAMLARRGYGVPRLVFAELEGYLKGFIDCVIEHDQRFYIVDWKSNHLGYRPEDYAREALDRAMVEHGYHLQHLLYTLAVHRYLARRLAHYRFDEHFGGVLYLFVRGVRPHWLTQGGTPSGVWFDKLDAGTLAELEHLFGHPQTAVAS